MNTVYTHCNQPHELEITFDQIEKNERRTLLVVLLTLAMMIVEILAGYITGSMALLADGYHMASHAGALGTSFLVYRLARSEKIKRKLSLGAGKLLPLGGYTSAIGLALIACWMVFESVVRLLNPVQIEFNEALVVSVIGLIVNIVSVLILGLDGDHGHTHNHSDEKEHHCDHHRAEDHHHDHKVHDHNHRSAVLHVLADALTSVTAIAALLAGKYFNLIWLDPLIGVIGAIVILKWAHSLCLNTAKELLDLQNEDFDFESIKTEMSKHDIHLLDFHIWRTGPSNANCQMIVKVKDLRPSDDYKKFVKSIAKHIHITVEQRTF